MKNLKNIILEKLVFNKHTKGKYNEFIFNPKEKDEDAKEINNLKISLPFDIIVTDNNQRITISKIKYEYESKYEFDAWMLYDIDDNYIMGITNVGIRRLLITNGQINISLHGYIQSHVIVDPKTLTIL